MPGIRKPAQGGLLVGLVGGQCWSLAYEVYQESHRYSNALSCFTRHKGWISARRSF